jgi:hypothetical protein
MSKIKIHCNDEKCLMKDRPISAQALEPSKEIGLDSKSDLTFEKAEQATARRRPALSKRQAQQQLGDPDDSANMAHDAPNSESN